MKQPNFVEKILRLLTVGDRLAVAVSGGVDSMTLLHAVTGASRAAGFSFFAVNIEHGIRGDASVADSDFVRDYCAERNIEYRRYPVDALTYSKQKGMTLEEGARALRYGVFEKLLRDGECTKVALAHHRSDQAETVLMRMIRGTGVKGLIGMQEVSGGYIRPLLDVSKEEIFAYAAANKVPYITDESNFDNAYTRNRIRNEIIPALKAINADVEGSLTRLSRLAAENEAFISTLDNPVEVDGDTAVMHIIEGEQRLLFKRRVRRCFEAVGVMKDVEERHVELVYGLLTCDNGASLDMPYGVKITREYDKLVFGRVLHKSDLTVPFATGKVPFGDDTVIIAPYCDDDVQAGDLKIDLNKMPQGAVLRHRKEGDTFTKFGGGTKSLGDYLTDKKIPLRLRDGLIVCALESEVLFIVGVEICDKVKTENTSEKIYKIRLEKA